MVKDEEYKARFNAAKAEERLNNVLYGMKARCRNPKSPMYRYYGGRGIDVCAEWEDRDTFRAWAYASGYHPGLTIDRINNNGNYEPNNCQWLTNSENAKKGSRIV